MAFSENIFACPIEGSELRREGNALVCEHGHSYDIAKHGYANLLPVQFKRSKSPGDSKDMVLARKRFLDAGHYQKIADAVRAVLVQTHRDFSLSCILDAGCGEGYYLDYLVNSEEKGQACLAKTCTTVGIDISKEAIQSAAKRNKQTAWLVASNRQPPLQAKSVDLILCLFGFPDFLAFTKILKPSGSILLVDPGTNHLLELRELIYEKVHSKAVGSASLAAANHAGFELHEQRKLHYRLESVANESLQNLFKMTPHFYKASKERREIAEKLPSLSLTVDVELNLLKLPEAYAR